MTAFATRGLPPRTLTEDEREQLLKATGRRREDYRDHMILSLALASALREHEIAALNVGDVYHGGKIRRRFELRVYKGRNRKRKPNGRRPAPQIALVVDAVAHKLRRFIKWKKSQGESLAGDAPLFCARREGRAVVSWERTQGRLSERSLRHLCTVWSERAALDQPFNFHMLRHTAVTNAYKLKRDLRVAQRFARHENLSTTEIYTHVDDEELFAEVRRLPG